MGEGRSRIRSKSEYLSDRIWLQLLRRQPRLTATTSILLPVVASCYIVGSRGRWTTSRQVIARKPVEQRAAGEREEEEKRVEWKSVLSERRPGSSWAGLALEILHGDPSSIKGHVVLRGRDGESPKRNFARRAAQKLNLSSSPHRRRRSGDENINSDEQPIFPNGYAALLLKSPPPAPPALLRRIGVKELTGVGKVYLGLLLEQQKVKECFTITLVEQELAFPTVERQTAIFQRNERFERLFTVKVELLDFMENDRVNLSLGHWEYASERRQVQQQLTFRGNVSTTLLI
ncbi:hypothetical protein WN51_01764 [Melipona quadrifasciata]|uniref:Uncharacterized protein n=1 Tax=Melipona quadrifasciata TaxID=166423 RepID=A0A0N0BF97_9HYME|nr:hypothetical protein WN51_01764 [Melipona quadrifasciata]